MKAEISRFILAACRKYDMQAIYIPDNDCYFIHKNGRAIQSMNTKDFYQLPKRYRMFMYKPLIQGLSHNLGEKSKDGLYGVFKMGKKIC